MIAYYASFIVASNKTIHTDYISGEKPRYKFNSTGPVLGVVGGSYSSVSLQVFQIMIS